MTDDPTEAGKAAEVEGSSTPSTVGQGDAELEREIRARRKFSVAEALGRSAGDLIKGASPVTLKRQAELEIELFLEQDLADSEGALRAVLLRRVRESEGLFEDGYEDPLEALRRLTTSLVESDARLRGFVRAVDAEWGRTYGERPYFEREGTAAHPEDPYTVDSVRRALNRLQAELTRREDLR